MDYINYDSMSFCSSVSQKQSHSFLFSILNSPLVFANASHRCTICTRHSRFPHFLSLIRIYHLIR